MYMYTSFYLSYPMFHAAELSDFYFTLAPPTPNPILHSLEFGTVVAVALALANWHWHWHWHRFIPLHIHIHMHNVLLPQSDGVKAGCY
jgi:hypothetical protein